MTTDLIQAIHPRVVQGKHPPPVIAVDGTDVPVDGAGRFDVPVDQAEWLAELADTYGVALHAIREGGPGVCEAVKDDGEVCGRDLPCQYHSDSEDES